MTEKMVEKSEKELGFESETLMILPESGLKGWGLRSSFWFVRLMRTNVLPRVLPRSWKHSLMIPRLVDIAQALGLSSTEIQQQIQSHQKRLSGRLVAYFIFTIPVIIMLLLVMLLIMLINPPVNVTSVFFSMLFLLIILFPFEFVLLKGIFVLLDKYYADSLCVQASLGVLVELTRPQVLNDPVQKRYLLFYVSEVARYTLLLPLCFRSTSKPANEKIQSHFHTIERFIREQEKLATIPEAGNLSELRKNFLNLTQMFISGNYGGFEWREEETLQPAVEAPLKWYQSLWIWMGKIVGLGIPLVGLYHAFVDPAVFSGLPIDIKTVTLILLAWLFLSIDSVLQLGLTAKVVTTAKEIKDLI